MAKSCSFLLCVGARGLTAAALARLARGAKAGGSMPQSAMMIRGQGRPPTRGTNAPRHFMHFY
eukprot:4028820-Pyramimonas_sp.AAC.1